MPERTLSTDREIFSRARAMLTIRADDSLRELIAFDEISSSVAADPEEMLKEWAEKNFPLLDADAREDFGKSIDQFVEGLNHAKKVIAEKGHARLRMESGSRASESDAAFINLIMAINLQLANRVQITGRAFLIAAESSFEVLFGQLARVIYTKNPAALPKSDHSFTLEEISAYDSIEDARNSLIDRKIETLLRESPDEWSKWLKRTVGLSMEDIMPDWPRTREIFTRRNMLVHTEGKVTERYLAEIQRNGGSAGGLEVGQSLAPSSDYLRIALQQLIAFEVLLVCKVLAHIDKQGSNDIASWLSGKLGLVMHAGRWDAACLIAESFSGVKCNRDTQLKVLVQGWLARKSRDGIDSIKQEVREWDISGLNHEYLTTKRILLDQFTAEDLSNLLNSGTVSRFEVLTNPLFANVREFISPPSP